MTYPKLVIFDCDGVISDTAYLHYKAWKKVALDKLNIVLDEHYLNLFKGLSREDSLKLILNNKKNISNKFKNEIIQNKNEIYLSYLASGKNIKIFFKTIELIKEIRSKNILVALASTSENSKMILTSCNIINLFDYLVDPSKIVNHKPAPDIFLLAANHFNIDAIYCWGIEDAKIGIKAINEAKMFSIGIGSISEVGEANIVFNNVDDIDFNKILLAYNKKINNNS